MNSNPKVLMVRPNGFNYNPETASTNSFMTSGDASGAMAEFEAFVCLLQECGIDVTVLQGPDDAPDAVFPNNWISFHGDLVAVYPMAHESRRRERVLFSEIEAARVRDFTGWESDGKFLEGTGSLVLDRASRVAYASLSPRTSVEAVRDWCSEMDYWPIMFEAFDDRGAPIYHTNVVLSVGSNWAVFCADACPAPNRVIAELRMTGKEVVSITRDQMSLFCGNVLELGDCFISSSRAWAGYTGAQREILGRRRRVITPDIATIESIGGGSVRCMIAEMA